MSGVTLLAAQGSAEPLKRVLDSGLARLLRSHTTAIGCAIGHGRERALLKLAQLPGREKPAIQLDEFAAA